MVIPPNDFDSTIVLFLNKFVGKSRLLDGSVELLSDKHIFGGVLFVAVLWLIWLASTAAATVCRCF